MVDGAAETAGGSTLGGEGCPPAKRRAAFSGDATGVATGGAGTVCADAGNVVLAASLCFSLDSFFRFCTFLFPDRENPELLSRSRSFRSMPNPTGCPELSVGRASKAGSSRDMRRCSLIIHTLVKDGKSPAPSC